MEIGLQEHTIGSPGEVRQIELDLIPSIIQPHGHCTNKGLDSGGRLHVYYAAVSSLFHIPMNTNCAPHELT